MNPSSNAREHITAAGNRESYLDQALMVEFYVQVRSRGKQASRVPMDRKEPVHSPL